MESKIECSMYSKMVIHELILEAHHDNMKDRRTEPRCPFFRPVSIQMPGGFRYSAFSREISTVGIGLLHSFELRAGQVEIAVPSRRKQVVRVRTRILWCRPCGEGWFLSGGQFVGVAGIDTASPEPVQEG